jgi:hypothetical protein
MSDKNFPIKKTHFLRESDFNFVLDPNEKPLNGVRFVMKGKKDPQIYYIVDGGLQRVKIKWQGGGELTRTFKRDRVMELFRRGDWIPYFGPITENEGSKDFDWIEKEGKDKIYIINKLKDYLGKTDLSFDVDYEYDYSTSDFGDVEYFGKIWFDTDDGGEHYVELIENSKGNFRYDVYKTEMDGQQYVIDGSKSPEKSADDFWQTVAFRILTLKTPNIKGKDFPQLDESKDFDWVEDVTPRMNATLLKPGQKFYDKWGDVIRVLEYLGRDDEGEVCYEPPCSLLRFRKIKDPSGYIPIPGLPADDPQNTDMIMIPSDFDKHIESGKLKLVSKRTMYESKDFEWVGDVELGSIDKNKNYVLDVSNLDLSDVEVHPRSSVSKREALLDEILRDLSELGYDTNTVRSELSRGLQIYYLYLTKSRYNGRLVVEYDDHDVDDPTYDGEYEIVDSVKDFIFMIKNKMIKESKDFDWIKSVGSSKIDKDNNYAIYLGKDLDFSGVNADDLGVHPKSKLRKLNKREMFINVFFNNLEEFGYDVETARTHFNFIKWVYLNGNNPPTTYDIPKMSLEYDDRFIEDPSWEGNYVVLHNPIEINHFIENKILGESIDDFDWVKSDDIDNIKLNNVYFDDVWGEYYYVYKITPSSEILLSQFYPNGNLVSEITTEISLNRFLDFLNGGRLKLVGSLEAKKSPMGFTKYHIKELNESSDFDSLDWVRDVKPKGFEKNKSYVVDVSNLMIDTPMSVSPTSERYTKLTRADIIDKFKELGYNVDGIPISDADYLYIEPNDKAGYWDDVNNWIKQTHWLDYDMKHNTPDPTWGGKYEVIDVNELMFLLDNKFISEDTDFQWVEDVPLTMNVCEAYHVLNPGDEIIIDEIDNWVDSPYRWAGEDGIQTHQNVKAKVLALDECSNIDKSNESNNNTILVSIDKYGYYGFDEMWSRDFVGDLPAKCRNNNCMFLMCDDGPDYEIRLVEKNKKPITEVAGISFESREWAKIINNEILKNPDEKERLIIDGYDYPEAFKSFPIDYVVIDFYDKLTGYGQEHSGYDKDGNYVVLLYIQPKVISGTGGFNLRTVLNHEMKHAWDDYNRISKGLPSIDKTKENRELYNKDFILMLSDKNITGPIKEILKYYYYLSELEKTAYLENVYDGNSKYEKIVRSILSKDFDEFKERFDLDVNWHLINTAYDIPFLKKFESPKEFIDKSSKDLKRKASETIKKINKMRYVHNKN